MPENLPLGRMISASKSQYHMANPDHLVVYNANVFTRSRGKVWHGDLDITVDGDALKAMAGEHGEELYILSEFAGRDHETNPPWDVAVARVTADAVMVRT